MVENWLFIARVPKLVWPFVQLPGLDSIFNMDVLENRLLMFCAKIDLAFCSTLVLTLPEGVEDFMVLCDASITGLGTVLM